MIDIKDIKGRLIAAIDAESLESADMSGINLRFADFRGANLYYADLSRSDLSGADLRGANLQCADLTWTDMSNVITDNKTEFPPVVVNSRSYM